MKDLMFNDFQDLVSKQLLRHRSILDIITKSQEACARVNRAVVKSATTCGCIKINAEKQEIPNDADISLNEIQEYLSSHISGKLCDNCKDAIEKELGNQLFYMASLTNTLDLNLYDIISKEEDQISTLGIYDLR